MPQETHEYAAYRRCPERNLNLSTTEYEVSVFRYPSLLAVGEIAVGPSCQCCARGISVRNIDCCRPDLLGVYKCNDGDCLSICKHINLQICNYSSIDSLRSHERVCWKFGVNLRTVENLEVPAAVLTGDYVGKPKS